MQIRTQDYAKKAYPLVDKMYTNKDACDYKKKRELEAEYRTQALNLPTMIMQSGLSQTVGFLLAKSKSDNPNKTKPMAFKKILEHLTILLSDEIGDNDLNNVVIQSDITQYQLLTRKAIEASSWLKRYTQALLRKKGDKDDNRINA
ncbi:MAG: type III-B CRISPR module-associated protein Cmr5 [Moraxella sp.]|nr:type III-B CRISPR module-associated protein Cmr5 [Moraxella sp.]